MAIDGSKWMSFKILCFNVDFTKIVIYTRVTRKTHANQIEQNTYSAVFKKTKQSRKSLHICICVLLFVYRLFNTEIYEYRHPLTSWQTRKSAIQKRMGLPRAPAKNTFSNHWKTHTRNENITTDSNPHTYHYPHLLYNFLCLFCIRTYPPKVLWSM